MSQGDCIIGQIRGLTVAVRGSDVAVVSLPSRRLPVDQHVVTSRATWREIVAIISKAALALEHISSVTQCCHHGSICSSDILVQDNGDCVVCHFRGDHTDSPSSYTAPEQLSGRRSSDHRTDIYRLGAVFYKLLTQREPFRADDSELLCEQIRDDIPQPPRQLVHGLPKELDSICLRMLAKAPADRIASGRQLAEELQRILRQFDDQVERWSQASVSKEQSRCDLVIIRIDTTCDFDLKSSCEVQEVLSEFDARFIACNHELLVELADTVSQDDAMVRIVTIGARLLQLFFRLSQGTSNRYRVQVESAEMEAGHSTSIVTAEHFPVSDIIRRAIRVGGEINGDRVEVDRASWQSLRRWIDHVETNDVAELRLSTDGKPLRVHIRSADPVGEMIGPASPLAIAKARWKQAQEGLGQMLLIIGEEGTGKSRIIGELVRQVEQSGASEVVIWNCIPKQQGRSFHPLARSLRQQLARVQESTNEHRSEVLTQYLTGIGEAAHDSTECLSKVLQAEESAHNDALRPITSTDKEGVQELILRWLGHATKQIPVLFVVEDLQWADPATLALVTRLAETRLYEHLLLIATFRPEFETLWGSRAHQTQVTLRRLSEKHIRQMFQSRLGNVTVDDRLIEQVVRATGGVPLYLEAYLRPTA